MLRKGRVRRRQSVRPRFLERLEPRCLLAGDAFGAPVAAEPAVAFPVVISEIMYHTTADDAAEEYIELLNVGPDPVRLQGWQFVRGIHFEFPEYSLRAGERLVVAADVETFSSRYPLVQNVVGNWDGGLSNRGETIELIDSFGRIANQLRYSDQGEWAIRAAWSAGPRTSGMDMAG